MDDSCLQAGTLLLNLIKLEPVFLLFFFFLHANCIISAMFYVVFRERKKNSFVYLMLFVSGFEQPS